MTEYGVVLFYTTSSATHAEKVLCKAALTTRLIPTPRQFSSDCGVSLRFNWDDFELVSSLLKSGNVELMSIRRM